MKYNIILTTITDGQFSPISLDCSTMDEVYETLRKISKDGYLDKGVWYSHHNILKAQVKDG